MLGKLIALCCLKVTCGNLFDLQGSPTSKPTTSPPTPAPTVFSIQFEVTIVDHNAQWSNWEEEESTPIVGCWSDCAPDHWCRILDMNGDQVRTEVDWNTVLGSWKNDPLTVWLGDTDIIDVRCWDEDGSNDDDMGWKHIDNDQFFPCGMSSKEFKTSKDTYITLSVKPVGLLGLTGIGQSYFSNVCGSDQTTLPCGYFC
jgi:hypothetical protein